MNILVFCHEFPPTGAGAGNALYHLSREWKKLGHQVWVVTSQWGDLPLEEVIGGVKIVRLQVGRKSVSRATLWNHLRFAWSSRVYAEKIYKQSRPDVSVVFMTVPAGLAGWHLKRKYGVPLVTQIRGGDVPGFGMKSLKIYHDFLTPLIRAIWKASDVVIANGPGLVSLAEKVLPGLKVEMIPNGVDADYFSPREKWTKKEELVALFAGRFDEDQKNVAMLIHAMSRSHGWRLRLAGDGKDRQKIEALARVFGVESRVEWTGWLKREALLEVYRGADFYLSASRAEGMPNSAIEAMSAGMPLILSSIPGHVELVTHGENGFLFKPHEESSLLECIEQMIGDADLRKKMGSASRARALGGHNHEAVAMRHLSYLEKCARKD